MKCFGQASEDHSSLTGIFLKWSFFFSKVFEKAVFGIEQKTQPVCHWPLRIHANFSKFNIFYWQKKYFTTNPQTLSNKFRKKLRKDFGRLSKKLFIFEERYEEKSVFSQKVLSFFESFLWRQSRKRPFRFCRRIFCRKSIFRKKNWSCTCRPWSKVLGLMAKFYRRCRQNCLFRQHVRC